MFIKDKPKSNLDLREQYLHKLAGYMEVLRADSSKETLGKDEMALIEAIKSFGSSIESTGSMEKLTAVENTLAELARAERTGLIRPFEERLADYQRESGKDLSESVASHNYSSLVPQVIAGEFIPTTEWEYIGSQILGRKRVQTSNTMVELYATTPMSAEWTAEGQRGREHVVDIMTFRKLQVKIRQFQIALSFTREALRDAMWPILETHTREAIAAMHRFREEHIWEQFTRYGHVVFDPDNTSSTYATTGIDGTYTYNDTMSVYDFLDLVATLYLWGFKPTDIMMHPMHYLVFVKTAMRGGLFLPEANKSAIASSFNPGSLPQQAGSSADSLISSQLGGLIPNVWTTPYVPFDVRNMKANVYVIDRNQIGTTLEREGMRRIEWDDMTREVRFIRFKDEMGVAIYNDGRAIAKAQNIAVDIGYNQDITFVYNIGN
jgi:hypothetical protein